MTTYTWDFSNLMVAPSLDGFSDVVVSLNYTLTGQDGDFTSTLCGSLQLQPPSEQNYTPYQQITKQQCQSWVEAAMGDALDVYQATIQAEIDKQKNPPLVERDAPWEA
jgi:hypothetical protein